MYKIHFLFKILLFFNYTLLSISLVDVCWLQVLLAVVSQSETVNPPVGVRLSDFIACSLSFQLPKKKKHSFYFRWHWNFEVESFFSHFFLSILSLTLPRSQHRLPRQPNTDSTQDRNESASTTHGSRFSEIPKKKWNEKSFFHEPKKSFVLLARCRACGKLRY